MINDPVPFLANIALVARADGKLSASELGQLESIRKEYGLKKSDFTAAVRLAEEGSHKLVPVGTFADQVKNLELILRVAYADSDLDEKETQLIADYCQSIGIHQEQLDRLFKEVIATLKQAGKLCPDCGSENTSEARFCHKCGASLDASGADVKVTFDIPRVGIAIEFAESTSTSYPKALETAKQSEGYQTCVKAKKTWHLAHYSSGSLADAMPLVANLSGMRNRVLYIDGKEQPWDEVFGFAWCASQRDTAYRPIEFCFGKDENRLNLWGCKQARMDWTEWADWFCYGKWEKSGLIGRQVQWRFDKERIRHELATNLYRYRYCPHMNTGLADAVIRNLPDTVSPETDSNWAFNEKHEEVPGAIHICPKSVL